MSFKFLSFETMRRNYVVYQALYHKERKGSVKHRTNRDAYFQMVDNTIELLEKDPPQLKTDAVLEVPVSDPKSVILTALIYALTVILDQKGSSLSCYFERLILDADPLKEEVKADKRVNTNIIFKEAKRLQSIQPDIIIHLMTNLDAFLKSIACEKAGEQKKVHPLWPSGADTEDFELFSLLKTTVRGTKNANIAGKEKTEQAALRKSAIIQKQIDKKNQKVEEKKIKLALKAQEKQAKAEQKIAAHQKKEEEKVAKQRLKEEQSAKGSSSWFSALLDRVTKKSKIPAEHWSKISFNDDLYSVLDLDQEKKCDQSLSYIGKVESGSVSNDQDGENSLSLEKIIKITDYVTERENQESMSNLQKDLLLSAGSLSVGIPEGKESEPNTLKVIGQPREDLPCSDDMRSKSQQNHDDSPRAQQTTKTIEVNAIEMKVIGPQKDVVPQMLPEKRHDSKKNRTAVEECKENADRKKPLCPTTVKWAKKESIYSKKHGSHRSTFFNTREFHPTGAVSTDKNLVSLVSEDNLLFSRQGLKNNPIEENESANFHMH